MFEQAGVAGLHIEDQTFPKRCGHLAGKSLIAAEEMCLKLRVAGEIRRDKQLLIIARTDAIAVEGFESAIARAKQYLAAGADMIFIEAPETLEQITAIAKEIPQHKLINMFYGGKTPLVARKKLLELGYKLVIIPSDLQRASIKAMQNTLQEINRVGESSGIAEQLVTFKEREEIVGTKGYFDRSKKTR